MFFKKKEKAGATVTAAPPKNALGKVVHFYDHISVAIIELQGPLKVGDTIAFLRGDQEFTQKVSSLQIDHNNVESAKKGDVVGMKVDQPTKEGTPVVLA